MRMYVSMHFTYIVTVYKILDCHATTDSDDQSTIIIIGLAGAHTLSPSHLSQYLDGILACAHGSSLLLQSGIDTPGTSTNARGHSPVGPQQRRRQQHLGGIRRTERGVVQYQILDLVLNDLARLWVQLVHAHPVEVQGVAPVADHLGHDDGIPRDTD